MQTVTITQTEYDTLLKDHKFMLALEAAGVENWDGYNYACEIYDDRMSNQDV